MTRYPKGRARYRRYPMKCVHPLWGYRGVNLGYFFRQTAVRRHPEVKKATHGCLVLYRTGMAFAVNEYIDYYAFKNIHAEINALRKTPKKYWKSCTLIVWRLRKNGNLGISKPCAKCRKFLSKHRIPVVYFSTDNGQFQRLHFQGHSIHTST
jgi:tRNA(Arg) A34 adenosine deaminase TadA